MVKRITGKAPSKKVAWVIGAATKIYVAELTETARVVQAEMEAQERAAVMAVDDSDSSTASSSEPLLPEHVHEAYRRLRQEGKTPRTRHRPRLLRR